MKTHLNVDGRDLVLDYSNSDGLHRFWSVRAGQAGAAREASLIQIEPGIYTVLANGRSYEVKVVRGVSSWHVDVAGHHLTIDVIDPRRMRAAGASAGRAGRHQLAAAMPGKVVRVLVAEGDEVTAGQGIVVVEAMKMQNEMRSPAAGRVVSLSAREGAAVQAGEVLAIVE